MSAWNGELYSVQDKADQTFFREYYDLDDFFTELLQQRVIMV